MKKNASETRSNVLNFIDLSIMFDFEEVDQKSKRFDEKFCLSNQIGSHTYKVLCIRPIIYRWTFAE